MEEKQYAIAYRDADNNINYVYQIIRRKTYATETFDDCMQVATLEIANELLNIIKSFKEREKYFIVERKVVETIINEKDEQ